MVFVKALRRHFMKHLIRFVIWSCSHPMQSATKECTSCDPISDGPAGGLRLVLDLVLLDGHLLCRLQEWVALRQNLHIQAGQMLTLALELLTGVR